MRRDGTPVVTVNGRPISTVGQTGTGGIVWSGGNVAVDPMPPPPSPIDFVDPSFVRQDDACTSCVNNGAFYHSASGACQMESAADGTVSCSVLGASVLNTVTTQYGGAAVQQAQSCCRQVVSAQANNGVADAVTCDMVALTTACANVELLDTGFCASQCHTVAVSMLPACTAEQPEIAGLVKTFLGNCAASAAAGGH